MLDLPTTCRSAFAGVLYLAATGCARGDEAPLGPVPPAVAITPRPLTVHAGASASLVVSLGPAHWRQAAEWQGATVRWSSEQPSIARVDTVVALGDAAFVEGIGPGTATLVALIESRAGAMSATTTVAVAPGR